MDRGREKMGPVAYFSLCLLGFLIFNPSLAGAQAGSCPTGWLSFQDSCYGYFLQELTWGRAEARCQSFSSRAHLASILSEEEHKTVAKFATHAQRHGGDDDDDSDDVWIGLHFSKQSWEWSWTDGLAMDYSAWSNHRSSISPKRELCVVLEEQSGFLTWDNDSCNDRNPFVCKYSL